MDYMYIHICFKKLLFYIVQQVHEMIPILDNPYPLSVTSSLCGLLMMVQWSKSEDVSPKHGTIQKLRPVLPGHPDILYSE